jgi:hypothetical protein
MGVKAKGHRRNSALQPDRPCNLTVANTGMLARLVPASEDRDRTRSLLDEYAKLVFQWERLVDQLTRELERKDRERSGSEPVQSGREMGTADPGSSTEWSGTNALR